MDKSTDKYAEYQRILGKKQCPLCKQFFKNLGFASHYRHCQRRNGDWSVPEKKYGPYYCKYCGKEWPCKNSKSGHQMKCHSNPKREECIQKISKSHLGMKMSEEVKEKIRNSMKVFHFERKKRGEDVVGKETITNKDNENNTLDLFFKDEL